MKRTVLLTLLLVMSVTPLLTACMSADQLAATVKKVKDRKQELDEKNPQIAVVYAKKDISKGKIIGEDDVEKRMVGTLDAHVPEDATHDVHAVLMKKAKGDVVAGQAVCLHDLAPLVEGQ